MSFTPNVLYCTLKRRDLFNYLSIYLCNEQLEQSYNILDAAVNKNNFYQQLKSHLELSSVVPNDENEEEAESPPLLLSK